MITKTTYIAFDGTEFSDKEECLAYEARLRSGKTCVIFFNRFMQPIDQDNLEEIDDRSEYIYIIDAEMAEKYFDFLEDELDINVFSKFNGRVPVHNGDIFVYEEDDGWTNFGDKIADLTDDFNLLAETAMQVIKGVYDNGDAES